MRKKLANLQFSVKLYSLPYRHCCTGLHSEQCSCFLTGSITEMREIRTPPPLMATAFRPLFSSLKSSVIPVGMALLLADCSTSPHVVMPTLSTAQARRMMFQAVKRDNPSTLRHALQTKVNVNQTDESGFTPLLLACRWGNHSCVQLLLTVPEIDVNLTVEDGETALYKAAAGGHSACITQLLKTKGIDVNKAENTYGWTPLTIAAIDGHDDAFRLLLKAPGININQKDHYGVNVLFHTAFNGYRDGVRRLLRMGVDLSSYDLGTQAVFRNDIQELRRLIDDGYNVNASSTYRMTPLLWAAGLGRTDCVRLLLQAGADTSLPGSDSRTALIRAAGYGHAGCLQLLLTAPGINPNQCDEDGETPLGHAAYAGHTECVRKLLKAPGIEVNKANMLGETPLFLAAMQGNTSCVKVLLEHPAINPRIKDKNGKTPLQIATSSGYEDCADLLRKR